MIALVKPDNRVASWFYERPDNWQYPDDWTVVETDFEFDPAIDPACYAYRSGTFTYIEPEPEPYSPVEAVAIMLRGGITDAEAVRLKPYLPQLDAAREYAEGDLAVLYGKAVRRTSTGWRELG